MNVLKEGNMKVKAVLIMKVVNEIFAKIVK